MKRKVTDLKENEAIHCRTQEEWDKIIALNPGLESMTTISVNSSRFEGDESGVCYEVVGEQYDWFLHSFYESDILEQEVYTIYPASDFLEPEFDNGEMIEVSNNRIDWETRRFIGMTKYGKYACDNIVIKDSFVWKHARKIEEQPTPEYTLEQLIEKVGHEFKIKK